MQIIRLLVLLAAFAGAGLPAAAAPKHVIVIAMENKDGEKAGDKSRSYIYGNTRDAPYLNGTLAAQGARATNFIDELSAYKSQPHYIVMEAGTNVFDDTTFTCDNDPREELQLPVRPAELDARAARTSPPRSRPPARRSPG